MHEPKPKLHWVNSIVITSKTVDWSEITNTARSKGLKKSWILQEYLSPPSTVPKVGTRRIPVIAVEKYGTGEKVETAFVDRHVINESAGVPWTYRPVHLSEERGVCVLGGGEECATTFSILSQLLCRLLPEPAVSYKNKTEIRSR